MTVVRLGSGERWSENRPGWSSLTAAGFFRLDAEARFDRHYHDCDEYWLIVQGGAKVRTGEREYVVGPGDLVCTPAGEEHDILETYADLRGFFLEDALPESGRAGHLHRDPSYADGHPVPRVPAPAGDGADDGPAGADRG